MIFLGGQMKFIGKTIICMALLAGVTARGADHVVTNPKIEIYKVTLPYKQDELGKDEFQWALNQELLTNIEANDIETTEWLLTYGAQVNSDLSSEKIIADFKVRPLTTALLCMKDDIVAKKSEPVTSWIPMVTLLLNAKADTDRPARKNFNNNRPLGICLSLIMSSEKYNLTQVYTMTRLLLEHGAKTEFAERDGLPLHDCVDGLLMEAHAKKMATITPLGLKVTRYRSTVDPELIKIVSERVNKELAQGLPKFSLDLTKLTASYVI